MMKNFVIDREGRTPCTHIQKWFLTRTAVTHEAAIIWSREGEFRNEMLRFVTDWLERGDAYDIFVCRSKIGFNLFGVSV